MSFRFSASSSVSPGSSVRPGKFQYQAFSSG